MFGVFDLTRCFNIEYKHSINEFKAERGNKEAPRIKQTNTLFGWKNSSSPSDCWVQPEVRDRVGRCSLLCPAGCQVNVLFKSEGGGSALGRRLRGIYGWSKVIRH